MKCTMISRHTLPLLLILTFAGRLEVVSSVQMSENLLIDRFFQFVWDPSALVYMWQALDRFYNLVLSWRMAGLHVVSLPFRQSKSTGDVIKINGRELAVGRVMTRDVPSHSDRIRMTYAIQSRPSHPIPPSNPYLYNPYPTDSKNMGLIANSLNDIHSYHQRFNSNDRRLSNSRRNKVFDQASFPPLLSALMNSNSESNNVLNGPDPRLTDLHIREEKLRSFLKLMQQLNPEKKDIKELNLSQLKDLTILGDVYSNIVSEKQK